MKSAIALLSIITLSLAAPPQALHKALIDVKDFESNTSTGVSVANSVNQFWIFLCGAMILLMQLGFAFLEGGQVRYKNIQSIMIKVFLNTVIVILTWWAFGYGFAFGPTDHSGFIATGNFFGNGFDSPTAFLYQAFLFQTACATVTQSIVSGGAAERMTFGGYIIFSFLFSLFTYPVAAHWAFDSNGWLLKKGYIDLAGTGPIHFVGGCGALTITALLKPRLNRWNPAYATEFSMANTTYVALSTFLLYVLWLFFNGGCVLGNVGSDVTAVGKTTVNTFLSGASGALTVYFLHYFENSHNNDGHNLGAICNGNLAGLVCITGGAHNVASYGAVIIGVFGGITYKVVQKTLAHFQIDDPVDAVPIHFGCGFMGTFLVGFFDQTHGILYGYGFKQLGLQLLGLLVFAILSFGTSFIYTAFLKVVNLGRVPEQDELRGIDISQCGGPSNDFTLPNIVDYETKPFLN